MGKGTIISGGTDGQYQLQVNYDRTQYNNTVSALDANIAELESKIAGMSPEDKEYSIIVLQKTSLEKRKQTLQNYIPEDETISAWCADLTEDLSGVVGTIEVPGESENIQIKPGYSDSATYNQSDDGQLVPTITQGAAQAFYNLAMLPGWQKWKPTFRYGTITHIDGDKANVTVTDIRSSQQNLGINQSGTLTNIDIEYMDCNGVAFGVGDSVLIKFTGQDWNNPKIIGFKDNPKPCSTSFFIRPKFNGHFAVYGTQRIKISCTYDGVDYSVDRLIAASGTALESYIETPITDANIPSEAIREGIDIKVELYSRWKNKRRYWGGLYNRFATFCHWALCDPYDPDAEDIDIKKNADDIPVIIYAKRIKLKSAKRYLLDCDESTIEYNGKTYPVYIVEFENLKIISRRPTSDEPNRIDVLREPDTELLPYIEPAPFGFYLASTTRAETGGEDYDPFLSEAYYDVISTITHAHIHPLLMTSDIFNYGSNCESETGYCLSLFSSNSEVSSYSPTFEYALITVDSDGNPNQFEISTRYLQSDDMETEVCDPCPWCECRDEWVSYDGGMHRMTWEFKAVETPSAWW